MDLTLRAIAEGVGGRLEPASDAVARGYSIDTRSIRRGDLFFAIQGPRFDGHDFVAAAAGAGASGAVVVAGFSGRVGIPLIRVGSTTEALGALARTVRRSWGGVVIGVTGSAGKTTTKELIAQVLGRRCGVLKSPANLNNEYGLPLSLLGVEPSHEVAVLEMGMSGRGEIRKLAAIAEPNEGVVTNVNPVHLEFFASVDEIALEKGDLLKGLVGNRRAYINCDDRRVRAMAEGFEGEVVTYGACSEASFRAEETESLGLDGVRFQVRHRDRRIPFHLPLLGTHNVSNSLAAISVGASHGVEWPSIQEAIRETRPAARRGEVHRPEDGCTLIDDSYNSNPAALTEMIGLLGSLGGYRRRILVAGEMLELGPEAGALHAGCGRAAHEAGIDFIVAVGGEAAAILDGARLAGADRSRLAFAPDPAAARDLLLARGVGAGDVVLIKGSRGVGLDRLVDELREHRVSAEP